ncbi:hypothetical protein Tco_1420558 [Tanacetum coccineum]
MIRILTLKIAHEERYIDASGNSDDQRTPIPPMPWIHVNSCKLDPLVSDATAKITSSDDHRIKRKRRQYRPKVKNIRHATPIPPAPPPPRASSLAQAPAPDHHRNQNLNDNAMTNRVLFAAAQSRHV